MSRLEKMRADRDDPDFMPEMPECEAQYLVSHFYEVGPSVSNGMGMSPISFDEIESWQRQIGIELQPWEVRALRRMSIAHCNAAHLARAMDAGPPWADAPDVRPLKEIVVARIRAAFSF